MVGDEENEGVVEHLALLKHVEDATQLFVHEAHRTIVSLPGGPYLLG
jgi:hypothetical protein